MSSGRANHAAVSYAARPDATPETETSALSAVYRFILDCHAKKEKEAVSDRRPISVTDDEEVTMNG